MKKILLVLLSIFLAYLTAFYVVGKENGYDSPFNFKSVFKISDTLTETTMNKNLSKGIKNLEENKYDDALKNFFDALSEENTSETNYYIGYTYLQKKDYKNALYYLNISIDSNSENSDAWLQKGITEYYQSDYQNAVNDLFFCTELKPEEDQAYYYLALCYEAQGKDEVALQSVETALQYDSLNPDSWFEAASLAYNINDYPKSINYYKQVLKILPKDKYSELNLGLAYSKAGKKDSALIWYNKTINDYPDYSLTYNNKGYIYQTEGKYELAVSYYSKAVKLNPESTYALWNRADSYFALKKYELAANDYEKVYEINSNFYNALWYAGLCYESLNKKQEALSRFQKFLTKASPDNTYYHDAKLKIKKLQ